MPAAKRQEKAAGSGEAKAGAPGGARPKQTNDQPGRVDAYGDPLPARALLRLGTIRFRHEGEACCLGYSPDGKFLAGKSQDGVITLWDARTGVLRRRIQTPFTYSRFAFSPDSRMLASAGDRRRLFFWDVATGKVLRKIVLPDAIIDDSAVAQSLFHRIRFSPDGKRLALGASDNSYVLDVEAGKVLHHFKKKQAFSVAAWSPDGKTLAVDVSQDSGQGEEIQVRSVQTGKVLHRLQGCSTIGDITFSPDGKRIASSDNGEIIVWDAVMGQALHRLRPEKKDYVLDLAFTPDSKTLVSAHQTGRAVRAWDVATGKEQRRFEARVSLLSSMALSPDGKMAAAGGTYSTIRLCDVATGREPFTEQQGHDAVVHSVAYSPDGKLLVSGGENGHVWIWDARTGKPVRQLPGTGATSVEDDGAGTRRERPVRKLRGTGASCVRFSPDGQRLAMLCLSMYDVTRSHIFEVATTVHIRDLITGKELFDLPRASGAQAVPALAYSRDGKTLFTADWSSTERDIQSRSLNLSKLTGGLNVWDAAKGRRLHRWLVKGLRPECLAVDPEGKTLAVGGASEQGMIRLWDLRRGEQTMALRGEDDVVRSLAFSPDGRTLVSGSHQHGVQLWETATGKEILPLQAARQMAVAVAFSPDGRVVAAGGVDRGGSSVFTLTLNAHPIRLWDLSTGVALPPLEGDHSSVTSLVFSPDGSRLASGMGNSTVLLWEAPRGMALPKGAPLPGAGELAALWSALAGEDAGKAHAAGWKLAAAEVAVPYLTRRLTPAPAVDPKSVRKLIADLDSDLFAVREAAARELEALGQAAGPALREALAGKPPLEVHRRLERLLARTRVLGPGEELRGVRAAGVLERIATPAARRLLERLAKGAPEARLTQEAKASLQRIAGRTVAGQSR